MQDEVATKNFKALLSFFDNYLPLTINEKNELSKVAIERKIKRKQNILQPFDTCSYYTFVAEGLFKMYATDVNGIEHILQFAAEKQWVVDIGSIYGKRQSLLYIEALEPSDIIQIHKNDLHHLYKNYPTFERIFRVIIENKFIELENRLLRNITFGAEHEYLNFVEQNPTLYNRLANTNIASYLGITPEFLSKIRKNIYRK
jgi:CRP-like cAMP-binding protein